MFDLLYIVQLTADKNVNFASIKNELIMFSQRFVQYNVFINELIAANTNYILCFA